MGNILDSELIDKIKNKNKILKKSLNFEIIKRDNINNLLKKSCHDSLSHYIDNFTIDGKVDKERYFLYLNNIVDFLHKFIKKDDFIIKDLLELHKIILSPLKNEKIKNIGELRTHGVITREKTYHTGLTENFISEHKVKKYINEIFSEYNNTNNFEGIIILYNYLIAKIHPFNNGNGRTLSILLDTLLIKYNYLPVFLGGQNKNKRVLISEDYIRHRNMNKLINDNYRIILDIYSNYQIK